MKDLDCIYKILGKLGKAYKRQSNGSHQLRNDNFISKDQSAQFEVDSAQFEVDGMPLQSSLTRDQLNRSLSTRRSNITLDHEMNAHPEDNSQPTIERFFNLSHKSLYMFWAKAFNINELPFNVRDNPMFKETMRWITMG